MKSAAVVALAMLESVNAFTAAPAMKASRSLSSPSMKFEKELNPGPTGVYDPLGFLDEATQEQFDRLRYVEIKHGRIAQLGFLHWVLIANGIHLPGKLSIAEDVSFADVGNGWAGSFQVPVGGALQILAFVGFLELFVMKDSANGAKPGAFPGDFRNGFIDFGWDKLTPDQQLQKRGIELNNGRAAMMGLLGLCVHEQLGVNPWQPLA